MSWFSNVAVAGRQFGMFLRRPNIVFQDTYSAPAVIPPYAAVSGNTALYTLVATAPYGTSLNAAIQTIAVPARIRRTLPAQVRVQAVTMRFRAIAPLNADDAAGVVFEDSALVAQFVVVPIRDAVTDPARRIEVTLGADTIFLGPSVTLGTWYGLTLQIYPGAGNSICQVRNLATGALHSSGAFPSAHVPFNFDSLLFSIDIAPGATITTQFNSVTAYGA